MIWKKYEFPPDACVVSCPNYMSVIIYFSGLYPWTSLMSHHCTANTKITTREDFSYVCTSTVLIPAGEEIVTNYVRVHHMFSRILSLLSIFFLKKSWFCWGKIVYLRKSCCFFKKKKQLVILTFRFLNESLFRTDQKRNNQVPDHLGPR